ncbi:transposase family protein [Clostridium gasigenes]|uniref:transposase family protein n=1 Tax=Clostridium gasigenes TaxID=94869 RepID=UPI001626FC6F|nr:transposase family protein [Clostridium gasigenes]MBB6625537.1 transposase family protein [Clostridium gasigenes]
MMSKAFFENKFNIEEINYTAETINITVKSKENGALCSKCGEYSNNPHSKYIRKFLDMPMIDKKTILFIISRRFYCKNSECLQVVFSE